MKNPSALPILESVLSDVNQDCMVRHEAAEAMGAIGLVTSIPILQKYAQDESRVIRETCELAIQLIEFEQKHQEKSLDPSSPYSSIDPAPPAPKSLSTAELKSILLNTEKTLFERYRAMFALRDRGDEESIQVNSFILFSLFKKALGQGFQDSSALFRHEIAYVFGQMQHPSSVPFLIQVLSNENEQGMVRHEAAEALGSIAHPDCLSVLKSFSKDKEAVVKESCIVGLDMYEYEKSGDFQYAEALPIQSQNY